MSKNSGGKMVKQDIGSPGKTVDTNKVRQGEQKVTNKALKADPYMPKNSPNRPD